MASHDEVMRRFAERGRPLKGGNVFADAEAIYSYGTHFPMAYAIEDIATFVLNGDRYSVTTSGHQSGVRAACSRNAAWTTVILPYSALRAARIMSRGAWAERRFPEDFAVLEQLHERNEWKCDACGIGWTAGYDYNGGHYAHEGHSTRHLLGGALLRANGKHYLTGIDETAVSRWGAGFFLVELPGLPETYAEALESLKPPEVVDALALGVDVKRQGDIFAIATPFRTRELPGPSLRMERLLEQNHVATEVRVNGETFARGCIYHRPEGWGRRPEHVRIKLGNDWHLIVRNTAVASYAAAGNVD